MEKTKTEIEKELRIDEILNKCVYGATRGELGKPKNPTIWRDLKEQQKKGRIEKIGTRFYTTKSGLEDGRGYMENVQTNIPVDGPFGKVMYCVNTSSTINSDYNQLKESHNKIIQGIVQNIGSADPKKLEGTTFIIKFNKVKKSR